MRSRKFVSLLMILIIVLLSSPSFADDDLSISRWIVESKLLENGDLAVVEDLTFDFKSKFNGVYRHIVTEGTDGIENLELYEMLEGKEQPYNLVNSARNGDNGVFALEEDRDDFIIKIFSPSKKNTLKTFRFKYIVKNVAVKHMDTGELYYKFIGKENPTPIEYFSASIRLPNRNRERTKIFAHGPLNGQINFIEDDLIKMEVSHVPAETFVEARILFPESFIGASRKTGNDNFDNIIDEELSYIRKIEQKSASRERNRNLLGRVSLYISFIGFVLMNFTIRKLRRNPEIFNDIKTLNPEDISPAELRAFMNTRVVDVRALMTTVFDLARKGYLTIEEIEAKKKKNKDFLFSKTIRPIGDLLSHEVYLLNWLFETIGDGNTVSTIDIEEYRKKHLSKFNKDFIQWSREVNNNLKDKDYYENKPEFGILLIFMSIISLVAGVVTLSFESLYGLIPIFLFVFLLIYGISLFTRKSDKGYVQHRLWKDIRNDLQNHRKAMKDYDTIPRDKTLIYALALGLPMKNMDRFRDYLPDSYSPAHWSYWYFLTNRHGGSSFEDRLNSSFYGGTASTTSSSIGGGGGFSAGGGGGAGGGGAGGF